MENYYFFKDKMPTIKKYFKENQDIINSCELIVLNNIVGYRTYTINDFLEILKTEKFNHRHIKKIIIDGNKINLYIN